MNKKVILLISSLFIIIGIYFLGSVGVKFFFNDYLYETPDLKGLTQNEAEQLLGGDFKLVVMGSDYSEQEKDAIYSQLPEPPRHIKYGRPIRIWISKGKNTVELPDLKGKSLQDARAILNNLEIKIGNISHTTDGKENNVVIGTDPKEGELVTRGSSISLLINLNKVSSIRMPDILGYSLREGNEILRGKGLVIGEVTKVYNTDFPNGTIIDANYSAGKSILTGTVIDVVITTNNKEE